MLLEITLRRLTSFYLLFGVLFSNSFVQGQALENSSSLKNLKINILQSILNYSKPGIGVDKKTGLPYDHIRINPSLNRPTVQGTYTSASKIGPYLGFWLRLIESSEYHPYLTCEPTEEESALCKTQKLSPTLVTLALLRIQKALQHILLYQNQERAEHKHIVTGMLPWVSITRSGKLVPDTSFIPILDNAIMSWSIGALIGAFQHDPNPLKHNIAQLCNTILNNQKYDYFINPERKTVAGTINAETGKRHAHYEILSFWTEDILVITWMILRGYIQWEDIPAFWHRMKAPVKPYTTAHHITGTVPVGYIASNHEIGWAMPILPYQDTKLSSLFFNSQFAQADYAREHHNYGFLSVCYDGFGTYSKMGLKPLATYPDYVQRMDCSALYGTILPFPLLGESLVPWIYSFFNNPDFLSKYGPFESIGPEGISDVVSADALYTTGLSLLKGLHQDIRLFLSSSFHNNKQMSSYNLFLKLFDIKKEQIQKENPTQALSPINDKFPMPAVDPREHTFYLYGKQQPRLDLIQALTINKDDRHGLHMQHPFDKHLKWGIVNSEVRCHYHIPKDVEQERRFAWAGTYMGAYRPFLIGYDTIEITIPNSDVPQVFELELKRENTNLCVPIVVDNQLEGTLSEDGQWKTLAFPLKHYKRYRHLPLTYVAFSIHDPENDKRYAYEGDIHIKNMTLKHSSGRIQDMDRMMKYIHKHNYIPEEPDFKTIPHCDKADFLDSGAIGEASRENTKEHENIIYMEFEHVDPTQFCGIWTKIKNVSLMRYNYLSFDILPSRNMPFPKDFCLEFKNDRESLQLRFKPQLFRLNNTSPYRVYIPLEDIHFDRVSSINIIHNNWETQDREAAYFVGNIVFYKSKPKEGYDYQKACELFTSGPLKDQAPNP